MFNLSRFSLKDKIAIVTGASRGIGQAIAYGYAAAGAKVVVISRNIRDVEATAAGISDMGGEAFPMAARLEKMEQITAVIDAVMKKYDRLDILVNNAGINPQGTSMVTDESMWDEAINLNLKSLYFFNQAAARIMMKQKAGKIINISSVGGVQAQPEVSAYCVSKAGVCMVTKLFALELAPYNVQVNTIIPGLILTRMAEDIWRKLPPEDGKILKAAVEQALPMRRMGEPDEVVGAAVYLGSSASSYTTGAEIVVDGAFLLRTQGGKETYELVRKKKVA